ncbi:MAG: 50S ribosomal protein L13 [Deltaproteobacteria bacterium]|jgi:large subunit ribosomal protein L13|nr:MAG: 50S ribosomal protein L13 [Deltaproteobacteria bacterium]
MYTQKSFVLKPADAEKKWWLIDAQDKVVGRLATEIADILRGKRNPKYTPHTDSGDFVVVINADKVQFTGAKWDDKKYYWHTGHIGGIKQRTAKEQLEKRPDLILMNAVKGMLPKNTLGRQQLTKLKVFAGESHNHEAQKPEVYNF